MIALHLLKSFLRISAIFCIATYQKKVLFVIGLFFFFCYFLDIISLYLSEHVNTWMDFFIVRCKSLYSIV